ncbi:MAG: VanZ family protein [Candidatus Omnitrophica bacterium]|nr:VanZ family protein [Candidatus Omnitrophota bacterium]
MTFIQKRKRLLITASVLWAGLLLVLSVQPEAFVMMVLRKPSIFPFAHIAAYGILAFLLCHYFCFKRSLFLCRMRGWKVLFFSFFLAVFCGGIAEAVQVFSPDRIPDWLDFECDMIGASCGIIFYLLYRKVFRSRSASCILEAGSLSSTF